MVLAVIDGALVSGVVWNDQNSSANVVARHYHQGLGWLSKDTQRKLISLPEHLDDDAHSDAYSVFLSLLDQGKSFNPSSFVAQFGCSPHTANQVLARHVRDHLKGDASKLAPYVDAVAQAIPASVTKMVEDITTSMLNKLFSSLNPRVSDDLVRYLSPNNHDTFVEKWSRISPLCVISGAVNSTDTVVEWDFQNDQPRIALPPMWARMLDALVVQLPKDHPYASWMDMPNFVKHAPISAAIRSKEDLEQQLDVSSINAASKKKM